jgi:hypothetical protein
MVGAWATEAKGRATPWTEERWAPPRAGTMLGTNLSGRGDQVSGYEYMRLAVDAQGTIIYWASPEGRTPVPFRLVSLERGEAVFVNPDHDFPTRIVYERTGYGMKATVSGPDGANRQMWRFKRIEP